MAAVEGQQDALVRLEAWQDVAQWLEYASLEFVRDPRTATYLRHVSECVKDEGVLRFERAVVHAS